MFHTPRTPVAALLLGVVALNIAAWGWAFAVFSDQPTLFATAFLAYVFGLRHAVDADHIAAIDNVVRKLMQAGQKPIGVGFFFSVGHASLVAIGVGIIATATSQLQNQFEHFREVGGLIAMGISAFFLLVVGLTNLSFLRTIWQQFCRVRRGENIPEQELNVLTNGGGILARLLRPLLATVSKSRHMIFVGFLFGLGFDTATEIALFSVAAGHASEGNSLGVIMVFPAMFAAGMILIDTLDSILMVGAYGWAFVNPLRKLWYNLTLTFVSVVVALGIGGLETLALVAHTLQLTGPIWDTVTTLNEGLAHFGYGVIGVFLCSWLIAVIVYRYKGYDRLAVGAAG